MNLNKFYIALALGAGAIALNAACKVSIPKGARAVKPFDGDKYLGKWFEIARMDFKFEKNLSNVSARYTAGEEGLIQVENRGYDVLKKKWKQSNGKAKFVRDPQEGRLKVSFFGPFYAGYNVIAIDEAYKYALVVGNDLRYIWILSREKSVPDSIKSTYLNKAAELGYDVGQLVWTSQTDLSE
ncbi:lipocalin family protein [Pedobacter sp. GR22-6]|uniref:lipocalin family protein n=1 Tax=Pedobacter sp. GR22-6 TaxID=3127957 RepID=UPI00307CD2C1